MMIQRRPALSLLVAVAIASVVALVATSKLRGGKRTYENGLICHVELTLMRLSDGSDEQSLECDVLSLAHDEMLADMSITIDFSEEFVSENKKALDAGSLYVHIPGGFVNVVDIEGFGAVGTSVHIPPDSNISVLDQTEVASMRHQRRGRRRTFEQTRGMGGTRSVMVFRITTDDASPDIGATEIEDRMFSPTSFSFASQFDKCSFGQTTFEAYDEFSPVTELYVPGQVSSFTERTILNAATRRAADAFGKDLWDRIDHAVFCMPDGTTGKPYIAYSGVGSFFSVYHNVRCTYPTTVMHEIAHNCGLGHAFENGEEYGDETTIMGFSSSSKTGPSKCFNGQNIWHFGWFKNRSTMVDPFQGHQILELSPFVDFDKTNGYQVVLITIFDMHIVYNRAKGFNAETSEHQNKVTIVKEENEINSALLAVLDMDQPTFTIQNILGSEQSLYIQLCDSVVGQWEADYYTISIGLDYTMCADKVTTASPTEQPTHFPTLSPTNSPTTPMPTYLPTTRKPSSSPTSYLPEIVLVPRETFTSVEVIDEDFEHLPVPLEENVATQLPQQPEESDSPIVYTSSLAPTIQPFQNQSAVGIISVNSALNESPRTYAAILVASFLTLFVTCCACSGLRWNQRRLDEQKRNLRLLQYNASNQVKLYMQDPV